MKKKLGALFYPNTKFDNLFIPYIYKEIYFEGIYVDICNQKKDMVVMDVGANIGIITNHFRPYAKKIYAIEPEKENFRALKKNKEHNDWKKVELFRVAIADKNGEMTLYQATGCKECGGIGYSGRLAIIEFLVMNDSLRKMVMEHKESGLIQEEAVKGGMLSIYQDGLAKAAKGLTTLDEVLRVTTEV